MKILFLSPNTPYPTSKATPSRAYHILTELAKRHRVSLAYWVGSPSEVRHINCLRTVCKQGSVAPVYLNRTSAGFRGLQALLQGRSYYQGYFGDVTFQMEVERLEKKECFDLIYVFTPAMAQYALDCSDIPLVVDFVELTPDPWERVMRFGHAPFAALLSLERSRRLRFDRAVAGQATGSIFASQAAADLFGACGGEGSPYVVPNGVGLALLRLPINENRGGASNRAPRLAFVGALDDRLNQDAVRYFVDEILPLVKERYPETSLLIAGRVPKKVARSLDRARGIVVAAEASDIRAHLVQAEVSVAPLRVGGANQSQICEALAIGVPVVASSEAIKPLPPLPEQTVLVGDKPAEFAAHIMRLFDDPSLRRRVAVNGRKFAAEHLSWKVVGTRLAGLLERLAQPASGRMKYLEPKHGAL